MLHSNSPPPSSPSQQNNACHQYYYITRRKSFVMLYVSKAELLSTFSSGGQSSGNSSLFTSFRFLQAQGVSTYLVMHQIQKFHMIPIDSFLRALREVAPEMELFLKNHGQYIKIFEIKLIYLQSCTFRHFIKKMYLEEYV